MHQMNVLSVFGMWMENPAMITAEIIFTGIKQQTRISQQVKLE